MKGLQKENLYIQYELYIIIIKVKIKNYLRLFDMVPPWNFGEKIGINEVEAAVHLRFDARGNLVEFLFVLVVYNRNYL